jgi:hypothetical protein
MHQDAVAGPQYLSLGFACYIIKQSLGFKVLTNEKRGGLNVVSAHTSRFKLITLQI